ARWLPCAGPVFVLPGGPPPPPPPRPTDARSAGRSAERVRFPAVSLLVARELVKAYRRRRVVDDVSLRVEPGEIVGLLGPNGAGKTTTFLMTLGMVRPDSGEVL